MTTSSKPARDLLPGDIFMPAHGTLWRVALSKPVPVRTGVLTTSLVSLDYLFVMTTGRMAGSGDKNAFDPPLTCYAVFGENEHVTITTDFTSRVSLP